jgi:ferritin-like metal-binding protein YciE
MSKLMHLFLNELADTYDAELQLIGAMPRFINVATCGRLQKLLKKQLHDTENHLKKLEKVFQYFNAVVQTRKCEVTTGLLKEGDALVADYANSPTINTAIISMAQKIKHYEIVSYSCLCEWAATMENPKASQLLYEIFEGEKADNEELVLLARHCCNKHAHEEWLSDNVGVRTSQMISGSRSR